MLKKTLAIFILLISCSAHAYDIKAYCKSVSDAVDGSYVIERECRLQESQAKDMLDSMVIPPRVRKYCNSISVAVGGSYQIEAECINQELQAKNDMQE